MSFGLLSVLGLFPVGLETFRNASDKTVSSQIAQRLLGEAQQTDFTQLTATPLAQTFQYRYFDDQGNETASSSAVYRTNLSVNAGTSLPGATPNPNLATVYLQVANNPGNRVLAMTGSNNAWAKTPGVPMSCYALNVASNN